MKTKLSDILDCLNTLRDYLTEAHQEELDSAHHGDEGGCSYCRAIAQADGILALNSDPDEHVELVPLLHSCVDFVSGFEGDESQEGIDGDDGLLAKLNKAVLFYGGDVPCRDGGEWHNFPDDGVCVDCGAVRPLPKVAPPTVTQMRQALLNTVESAKELDLISDDLSPDENAEGAHTVLENVGLDLCRAGGFHWEQALLPYGGTLEDYCLKATSLECAEATLLAFDLWAGKNL